MFSHDHRKYVWICLRDLHACIHVPVPTPAADGTHVREREIRRTAFE